MYDEEAKVGYAMQGAVGTMRSKPTTIREELMGEIHHLEERLAKKKEMVELLDRNPDIEKFTNLARY